MSFFKCVAKSTLYLLLYLREKNIQFLEVFRILTKFINTKRKIMNLKDKKKSLIQKIFYL